MDHPTSVQQRKDEILAKKAKLAELKRQRELRAREFSATRQSIGDTSDVISPSPSRVDSRKELDSLISSLVGESRPSSTGPRDPSSPALRSRPTSVVSGSQLSGDQLDVSRSPKSQTSAAPPQRLSFAPSVTVYDVDPGVTAPPPKPKPEYVTYTKSVQTSEEWTPLRQDDDPGNADVEGSPSKKRPSLREQMRDEELRQQVRKEMEAELRAAEASGADAISQRDVDGKQNFPARALTDEELNAVTGSDEFLDFVERSSKVLERALDQEYDILADYALGGGNALDEEEDGYGAPRKKSRRVKDIAHFWDDRWSKKRVISDIGFSPKFPELVLASYTKNPSAPHDPDGVVQVWNLHMHDRPEYIFHAQSDILTAKFSPFHPHLILGGCYSGQVLLWDTRTNRSSPVQKTPLTGSGHTHPVYALDIVGTQNANNIISASTDGVVCSWSVDMLSQPQEYLELTNPHGTKTDEFAPTCIAFPASDPTYFLAGSEEGVIFPCHRYDRAGAKAGLDPRLSYRAHSAPVMSLDFHPARGPVDLGDLVLSSSLDWTVRLWRARPPSATAAAAAGVTPAPSAAANASATSPLMEFPREDLVYDAKWSPIRPGIFALVDGAGSLEIWDVNNDVEIPSAKVKPSELRAKSGKFAGMALGGMGMGARNSLNKVAWEGTEGKRIATGGLDGVVSVFEVGNEFGGTEGQKSEEWAGVKKLVVRCEAEIEGRKAR
ncbi:cytoplasmic dynein intermediate chain [Eremomyces bilateralis CBS 781.70]|uniref:Cytoplasmic dynein intermediate chain n=1 Tax=Eremomyces bilateralis CBS 781.70 TaxID=1392243 RepID=A0A6G1G6R3_9PEZI|nr:cytoplasmic dynein intermediate chain [Eremomyces bilateralis CBS 781.70]KAF1813714.1 cytoplasmic dynein intermediate chain [Eremomyces bilateralis CBS 781.70]